MDYDVIVVGGGNAAFAAAVSAKENGAKRVLVLEKAPKEKRGGNTHFSGAVFRFIYNQVGELDRFVPTVETDYPGFHKGVQPYPVEVFREDLMRVTQGRSDPGLASLLIENSYDTMCWLQDTGKHHFELAVSVMGVKVGNEFKWPRGAMIRTHHEGVGLSRTWFETAEKMGIEIRYETGAQRLTQAESGRVTGVVARGPDGFVTLGAKAVVLA
jgi:tricarballylate dehydrogenase